ncbi:MAG: NAD-dependent epimerase/dehydratase family protein [Chlamydiia bacterium]|nr:NAD-dependent epimerase/dehydratase family protein [Chlamydiia bacterium]
MNRQRPFTKLKNIKDASKLPKEEKVKSNTQVTKVLITGGCGFIGSHLSRALLEQGVSVRVLDDLSTGTKNHLPHEVELIEGSLLDKDLVAHSVEGIHICYHLGAVASVEKSITNFSKTTAINLLGTIHLFETISKLSVPIPIIYASSAAVYAGYTKLPFHEDLSPLPSSPYGADKGAVELYAKACFQTYQIPTIGFRFFNVYGPGQDSNSPYSGVISIFCDKIRKGEEITIFGNGTQTRDFIHISDVICYLVKALEFPFHGCQIYNLCTGVAISINQLVDTFEQLLDKKIFRKWVTPRKGEPKASLGDPRRTIRDFDIKPQCSLEEGLKTLIESQERNLCV